MLLLHILSLEMVAFSAEEAESQYKYIFHLYSRTIYANLFDLSFLRVPYKQKCMIKGMVVGMRARIGKGVIIEDSVIMGFDTYQVRSTHFLSFFHFSFSAILLDQQEE